MNLTERSAEKPEAVGVLRAIRIVLAFPFFFLAVVFCILAAMVEFHDGGRETMAGWVRRRLL